MSASLKNQQGFSLPEVMLAMVLMVMIVTALSGFQRTLMNSLASRNQYQQLWRHGWQQTQLRAISPPANWQVNRMQTSQAGCVSISVTLVSPGIDPGPGRICFRISAIHPLIITYSGVATRRLRAPITALKKLRPALPLIAVLL